MRPVLCVALVLLASALPVAAQNRIRLGKPFPDFQATLLSGEKATNKDFHDKVLLIDFWATWCGPCVKEIPTLKEVYDRHHKDGLEVLSFSLDRNTKTLENFIRNQKLEWNHVHDLGANAGLAAKLGVRTIPRMVLVGPDGVVLADNLRGARVEEEVAKALVKRPNRVSNEPAAVVDGPDGGNAKARAAAGDATDQVVTGVRERSNADEDPSGALERVADEQTEAAVEAEQDEGAGEPAAAAMPVVEPVSAAAMTEEDHVRARRWLAIAKGMKVNGATAVCDRLCRTLVARYPEAMQARTARELLAGN